MKGRLAVGYILALAFSVLAAAVSGCSGTKREAESLAAAVDRYRLAPVDYRADLETAIELVQCTDPEVCAAKEACVASAKPTVNGVALKRQVAMALAEVEGGRMTREQAAAMGLSAKLDAASKAIEEGRAAFSKCEAGISSLRLKYGF